MADNANPYKPPASGAEAPRRRTRWRILFVAPVLILGLMLLLSSPLIVVVGHFSTVPGESTAASLLAAAVLTASTGALFIASAILYSRGAGVYAFIAFALAVGVYMVGGYLLSELDL